jgi:hypothetical protein
MTAERRSIYVVAPVFYDTEPFLILRERLLSLPDDSRDQAAIRFVVVDDSAGSDPGIDSLRALSDVEIVQPPFNLGHQRAIVFGLRQLASRLDHVDFVVTMDADGEDRPEDLPRLLAALNEATGGRSIALAMRTKRRETFGFKLAYALFRAFFRIATGEVVQTGNFAAWPAKLIRPVIRHPYFDMSYASTLISLQVPRVLVPCERGVRYAGRSRMGPGKLVTHGLGMLMPFTERVAVRALLVFSATIGLAAVAALVVLWARLFTETAVPGWATYTLLMLLILSAVALGNFIVLFAVFAQTRAISMANIHLSVDEEPSMPPHAVG